MVVGLLAFLVGLGLCGPSTWEILGLTITGAAGGFAGAWPFRFSTAPRTVAEVLDALVALEPAELAADDPLIREWIEEIVTAAARPGTGKEGDA